MRWNVSYVTYVGPVSPVSGKTDVTIVVESGFQGAVGSSVSALPTTLNFRFMDGLATAWAGSVLHTWRSNASVVFQPAGNVSVAADGTFSITIEPSAIVTMTTVASAHPGAAALLRELGAAGPVDAVVKLETADGPDDEAFPLPYADDFERYGNDSLPLYLSDMYGAFATWPAVPTLSSSGFGSDYDDALCNAPYTAWPQLREVRRCAAWRKSSDAHVPCSGEAAAARSSRCRVSSSLTTNNTYVLRQYVSEAPIGKCCSARVLQSFLHMKTINGTTWCLTRILAPQFHTLGWSGDTVNMVTIIGSYTWRNVTIAVNALIEAPAPSTSNVVLALRAATGGQGGTEPSNFYANEPSAYAWRVYVNGTWVVVSGKSILARGVLAVPFGTNTWHALSLAATDAADGSATLSGTASGESVFSVRDARARDGGYAVLGTGANAAQFDNLLISRST